MLFTLSLNVTACQTLRLTDVGATGMLVVLYAHAIATVEENLLDKTRSNPLTLMCPTSCMPSLCPFRNAPKCSNRKFWDELKLIDARTASTPAEMLDACLRLLEDAGMSCATTANIVVFRAQTPSREDGPRVWNNQLIR
jgi:hypothetical protein